MNVEFICDFMPYSRMTPFQPLYLPSLFPFSRTYEHLLYFISKQKKGALVLFTSPSDLPFRVESLEFSLCLNRFPRGDESPYAIRPAIIKYKRMHLALRYIQDVKSQEVRFLLFSSHLSYIVPIRFLYRLR